jgi:hypothetical protein
MVPLGERGARVRVRDGRTMTLYTAKSAGLCDVCSTRIAPGDVYVVSKRRDRRGARMIHVCVARCSPLAEPERPEPSFDAAVGSGVFDGYPACGYCERRRPSVKWYRRLDPRTLNEVHRMALCSECAETTGYVPVEIWTGVRGG